MTTVTVVVRIGDVEVAREERAVAAAGQPIVVDVDPHRAASAVGKTFKREQWKRSGRKEQQA